MATPSTIAAIIIFTPSTDWLALPRELRQQWLRDRIAALREYGFGDDSRLVWSRISAGDILTLWYINGPAARDRLVEQLERSDVQRFFN
jgi:hypothetical protein